MLLCYITDRTQFPGGEKSRRLALLRKIGDAARRGVDFIQLREKDLSSADLERFAELALKAVRDNSQQTRLLINSRTDVAIACGADGVHLRSNDILPSEVRKIWGQTGHSPIISVSCHSPADVAKATAQFADFALFAPIFGKKDAPQTRPAGLDELREASQLGIPVLALGGITLENAQACLQAGAAGIAGIRLFQEGTIEKVVSALRSAPVLGKVT